MSTSAIERLHAALSGRYHIERELGEGGMATVYLADDLKHERKVALKVLKPELAAVVGAERFLAEIKTTAKLQHPHILPLFDSGEADSFVFYAMPWVEGESLRQKLDREHQLPVEAAVRIATYVAEALDYAHRHGVVHRDIKPGNVLLHDGQPVISDFGIALAVGAAGQGRLTETGLSLGTPHYMSPEQATGDQTVGPATDTYALACVLYEMLVGEPPHTGSTAQAILGKIIAGEEVSVTAQRRAVPANVDAAIAKALEKLPADRFTGAQDFANALADPGFRHGAEAEGARVAAVSWKRMSIATTTLAVAMSAVAIWGWLRPAAEQPVIRYPLGQLPQEAIVTDFGTSLTLSPDGSRLVYVGPGDTGDKALWVKEADESHARPIPGTEGAFQPFFSPDGRRVGFIGTTATSDRAVKLVSLETGAFLVLTDSGFFRLGASWGADGNIYLVSNEGHLIRIPETLGPPEPVTELASGEGYHSFPDALPSGRGVLFTASPPSQAIEDANIAVVDLATGEHRVLVRGVLARYAATGHLVYVRNDGTLLAAPFDQMELVLTGEPVPLFQGVSVGGVPDTPPYGVDLALAAGGTLAYVAGQGVASVMRELVWVDRDGAATPIDPSWTGQFESVALSPDGTQLVATVGYEAETDLWMKQLDRGPQFLLTFTEGLNRRATWTGDGLSVTFITDRDDNRDVYVKRADGVGPAEVVRDLALNVDEGFWSPDGDWLIYRTGVSGEERDVFAWRSGPDSVTVTVAAAPGVDEVAPTLSPDGQWLAYVSNESGRSEVWVRSFPDVQATRRLVSVQGGTEPVWARSGQELFYKSQDSLMVVGVQTAPTFTTGQARSLFSTGSYYAFDVHRAYDVAGDGQRFVMINTAVAGGATELVVVQNFFEELKRRVPG